MTLLSIHVPSNKPRYFRRLVENLLDTVSDPNCFEVVVKIDTGDTEMANAVKAIQSELKLNLTVVISKKPESYFHVWQCMNEIYEASDPKYYFCWHINDEILLETEHWDKVLARYKGLFPDRIYRLKISPNKFINLHSIHEVCLGADYPIVPRRWLEISGNWADYHGADSYQEGISFCLGKYGKIHRNVPLIDFIVGGDPPGENLDPAAEEKRNRGIIYNWDVSMAHRYQEDFLRRARRLELAVRAHEHGIEDFVLEDDRKSKLILLKTPKGEAVRDARSYARSRVAVFGEHLFWVLKRHHRDELRGKPIWFSAMLIVGKFALLCWFILLMIFRMLVGIATSLMFVAKGDWVNGPLVRSYRNIFIKNLPLAIYIPTWIARFGELVVRRFPALTDTFRRLYLRGTGKRL